MSTRLQLVLPLLVTLSAALFMGRASAQAPPADLLDSPALDLLSSGPIVIGEANADGHADVIYYRYWPDPPTFAAALGDGLGGFDQVVQTSIVPGAPTQLRGGDLDHDGDTDVAFFVGPMATTLQVLLSQGDGSFSGPTTLPPAHPGLVSRLLMADATGDGHLDLVASQTGTPRFTLYVGVGDGTFVSPPSEIIALVNAAAEACGDFDGDGHLDLAISGGPIFTNDYHVLFGTGGGAFGPPQLLGCTLPTWVAVGDLTGDGRDDLAPVYVGDQLAVLSWSSGSFVTTPIDVPPSEPPATAAAIGDIDRDGQAELLLAEEQGRLAVYRPSIGSFEFSERHAIGQSASSVHLADVDEDGGIDVLTKASVVTVLAGQGDGDLEPFDLLAQTARDAAVGDATGDGFPDVVCVYGAGKPAQLLRGSLGGALAVAEPIDLGPEPEQVWMLDVTGDGVLDLLASGGSAIAVAAGHGDGHFDPPQLSPVNGDILHAEVAPFGGDALPDLAVSIGEKPSFVHFLVNAGGSFVDVERTAVTPPAGSAYTFAAADVDGDLDTDLIVAWTGGYLRVFIHQPLGYEPAFLVEQYFQPPMVVTDLDLDGDVDIAVNDFPGVVIRSGDGTGDFSAVSTVFFPAFDEVTVGDLDADGRPDFVGSRSQSFSELGVVLAQPGGGYGGFKFWPVGSAVRFSRPADMNGDGMLDLVVVLGNGQLGVVENGLGPWAKRGHSLAGAEGFSRLQGFGPLTPGSPVTLRVSNGLPSSMAFLIAGPTEILAPFKGGVLVPQPTLSVPLGLLDATGAKQVSGTWPATMPAGAGFSMQVWRPEAGAPSGFGATTAIRGTAP